MYIVEQSDIACPFHERRFDTFQEGKDFADKQVKAMISELTHNDDLGIQVFKHVTTWSVMWASGYRQTITLKRDH